MWVCARCGMVLRQNDDGSFSEAGPDDIPALHTWAFSDNGDGVISSTRHWCACGACSDAHVMSAPVNGVSWCTGGEGGTEACDYCTRGQTDKREGEDSEETGYEPYPPRDDEEDEESEKKGRGSRIAPRSSPLPGQDVVVPEPPLPPIPGPLPDLPGLLPVTVDIDPSGKGDSTTIDPNVHRNDWQVVSAPYPPPPLPDLLPIPPDLQQ